MKKIDNIISENINKYISKAIFPIGMRKLNEVSINRILSHGSEGMIIVSAWRSSIACEWKPEISLEDEYRKDIQEKGLEDSEDLRNKWLKNRNEKCNERLKNDLRKSIYSFTEVYGGYHNPSEKNSSNDSYEPSYIIYNRNKKGESLEYDKLEEFGLFLGKLFAQDSVYVQKPGEAPNYIDPRNGDIENSNSSKNVTINRDNEEYFTTNKRKKNNPHKFHADINFENKFYKEYGSLLERYRALQKYGEIYL